MPWLFIFAFACPLWHCLSRVAIAISNFDYDNNNLDDDDNQNFDESIASFIDTNGEIYIHDNDDHTPNDLRYSLLEQRTNTIADPLSISTS